MLVLQLGRELIIPKGTYKIVSFSTETNLISRIDHIKKDKTYKSLGFHD